MAAFATTQQRYHKTIITMVKSQAAFILQPIAPVICHMLPHIDYGFPDMRALHSELLSSSNFPYDNHHQHVHNPSITLSCQKKHQLSN